MAIENHRAVAGAINQGQTAAEMESGFPLSCRVKEGLVRQVLILQPRSFYVPPRAIQGNKP